MTYATEFRDPDVYKEFAEQLLERGFEDTSWGNDMMPSFTCDVFVVWVDHAHPEEREFPEMKRFAIHDEGETVLETDAWADVLAFIDDGKRVFS
jgi:hypothetical protein